jgi:transcriptional regulator with XRE-family HTH domain
MKLRRAFGQALRQARKAHGLTQEDFSVISSRTYLSTLERGQKSPTLDKIIGLSQTIGIHHLSLLTLAHLHAEGESNPDVIFDRIKTEIDRIRVKNDSAV